MARLQEITAYCDQLLSVGDFQDYAPNGLQVEGAEEVSTIVSGVTASQALVEEAAAAGADLLLVHHGYFWKGEDPRLVGMKGRRVRSLMRAGISLLAYHLPLDAHPTYGNNAQLGELLGLEAEGQFDTGTRPPLGWYGRLARPMSAAAFAAHLAERLGRPAVHVAGGGGEISRVAWCTGGAQGFINQAAGLGVDAYLSGEISEPTAHVARECGLHYFAAGHHATERYGARALGQHLAERFGVEHRFIDLDNPA